MKEQSPSIQTIFYLRCILWPFSYSNSFHVISPPPPFLNETGLARYPCAGTTNLHLDISDAVNVMVHVGIPHGGQKEDDKAEALISGT